MGGKSPDGATPQDPIRQVGQVGGLQVLVKGFGVAVKVLRHLPAGWWDGMAPSGQEHDPVPSPVRPGKQVASEATARAHLPAQSRAPVATAGQDLAARLIVAGLPLAGDVQGVFALEVQAAPGATLRTLGALLTAGHIAIHVRAILAAKLLTRRAHLPAHQGARMAAGEWTPANAFASG